MAGKFDINNVLGTQDDTLSTNTFDDLFGEDFGNDIFSGEADSNKLMSMAKEIDIARIKPSPKNPYKVLDNDEMETLSASIESEGILNPLIARPAEGDSLELVSGHRRLHAAKKLGLKKVPVIVKDMTDEQADVWMVDLNLNRETILPSEKAKAIKLKYNAIKRSWGGARTPLEDGKGRGSSAEIIAKEMGMTDRNLRRYILLADMTDKLLDRVDAGTLTQRVAEQLAHLSSSAQDMVDEYLNGGGTISQDAAKQLKVNFGNVESVSEKDLLGVLNGKAKKPVKAKNLIRKITKELQEPELDFTLNENDRALALDRIQQIRARLDELEKKLS